VGLYVSLFINVNNVRPRGCPDFVCLKSFEVTEKEPNDNRTHHYLLLPVLVLPPPFEVRKLVIFIKPQSQTVSIRQGQGSVC